jgi:hypothetical protein
VLPGFTEGRHDGSPDIPIVAIVGFAYLSVVMNESIASLAASIVDLHKRAVREYTPIVAAILRSRSRDTRNIEHTLDGLLDFCGHAPVVRLFRELCRHYYFINPVATAGYVHAYREMWDSEPRPLKAKRNARPKASHRSRRKAAVPKPAVRKIQRQRGK